MSQRVVSALALLLGIALVAHFAYVLLSPLIPMLCVLLFLGSVATFLFRGRR